MDFSSNASASGSDDSSEGCSSGDCSSEHEHERLALIEERYVKSGLRRTKASRALLKELASQDGVRSLGELCATPRLAEFDQTTIYRQLLKLAEHGLVRELGLPQRASAYFLVMPGEHRDFLLCRKCGKIQPLQLDFCPARELEEKISQQWGYSELYHELEFIGVCGDCGQRKKGGA